MTTAFLKALGNLFRSPATVRYPFEKTYKPDNYRGLIQHHPELCIYCRRCELSCPPGAIVFAQEMDGKQTYHYNPHVCVYCGECVRSCPKAGALVQTAEPASPATKADNINNGWGETVRKALKSRADYQAEVKRRKAEEAAKAQESKPAE